MNGRRIKKSIITTWKRKLNDRKQAYWNNLKLTKTTAIYEKWALEDIPVMPRKFRPKAIPGENADDKDIRKDAALYRFTSEIKIMKNKAARNLTKYSSIDEEVRNLIKRKSEIREVQQWLINQWEAECRREEEKSMGFWMKRESWLNDYSKSYGRDIFIKIEETTPPGTRTHGGNYKSGNINQLPWNRRKYSDVVKSPPRPSANRPVGRNQSHNSHGTTRQQPYYQRRNNGKQEQRHFLGQSISDNAGGGKHLIRDRKTDETLLKEIML